MRNTFRIIAIFVMCFMLVNIVMAPPASAIAFSAGTVVSVAAAALIPAMIVGLGLFPESSDAGYEAFSQLCANVDTMLTDAGQAIDDRIDVIRYGGINYVSSAMLQTVKDWFFSSGSLTYNYEKVESNEGTFTANGEEIQFSVPSGGVIIHRFYHRYSQWRTDVYNETLVSVIGTPSFSGYINSYSSPNTDYVTYLFRQDVPESEAVGTFVSGTFTNAHDLWYYRVLPQLIDLTPPVSTGTGITFGSVKPLPDTDIETNYETWIGIQFEPDAPDPEEPTEPSVPYFPIKIPDWTYTDPWTGYPDQQEIQNPSPTQEPDPDTSPDSTTPPDSSTDTDPSNPGASGDVSTKLPNMVIDLTDFFPFCIPFDIYKFLSILAADPVAPEFDLKLHGFNQDFVFHVDLSPFDGLAALVRSFELMGFIIGLGMVTRNKFLRA